jgi:hypothetical protein
MTLGELVAQLHIVLASCENADREVVLVEDQEGNGARPLESVKLGVYVPHNSWSGDIHDYDPCYTMNPEARVVVALWPAN